MNLLNLDTLAIDSKTNDLVVLLETAENEVLPIWIGNMEGISIAMKLAGKKPRRPMTHDFMASILNGLNVRLIRVVITSLVDDIYYALAYFQKDGDLIVVDARPSDSIALALRTEAPIFAADDLPLVSADEADERRQRLDKRLRRIEPEQLIGE